MNELFRLKLQRERMTFVMFFVWFSSFRLPPDPAKATIKRESMLCYLMVLYTTFTLDFINELWEFYTDYAFIFSYIPYPRRLYTCINVIFIILLHPQLRYFSCRQDSLQSVRSYVSGGHGKRVLGSLQDRYACAWLHSRQRPRSRILSAWYEASSPTPLVKPHG